MARLRGVKVSAPDFQTVFWNGSQFPIATLRDLDTRVFSRRRWIGMLEAS